MFVRYISGLALLAASFAVSAAEVQSAMGIFDLLDASRQHPSVQLNQNEEIVAGYRRDAARWARYPSFTADASAPFGSSDTLTLKLEQPLWTGGRVEASIQAAEREVDVSRARTREAVDTIQLQVIDAYAEFWRSQAKLAASYDNVAALDELLAVITRRVAQEVSPRTEQVLAEARLQQALSEREQFSGAVDVAKSLLLQATNISVDKVYRLYVRSLMI